MIDEQFSWYSSNKRQVFHPGFVGPVACILPVLSPGICQNCWHTHLEEHNWIQLEIPGKQQNKNSWTMASTYLHLFDHTFKSSPRGRSETLLILLIDLFGVRMNFILHRLDLILRKGEAERWLRGHMAVFGILRRTWRSSQALLDIISISKSLTSWNQMLNLRWFGCSSHVSVVTPSGSPPDYQCPPVSPWHGGKIGGHNNHQTAMIFIEA